MLIDDNQRQGGTYQDTLPLQILVRAQANSGLDIVFHVHDSSFYRDVDVLRIKKGIWVNSIWQIIIKSRAKENEVMRAKPSLRNHFISK